MEVTASREVRELGDHNTTARAQLVVTMSGDCHGLASIDDPCSPYEMKTLCGRSRVP